MAIMCNLGNLSWLLGRKLRWDGAREEVIGGAQANRLLGKLERYPAHL